MCAINPALYGPTSTSVNEAYKNAGKCLQYFVQAEDTYHFHDMRPLCRDIVRLYDYIRFNWKDAYNAEDEPAGAGGLERVQRCKKDVETDPLLQRIIFSETNPCREKYPLRKVSRFHLSPASERLSKRTARAS